MRFIGRFMVEFGLLSSAFDLASFAVLLVWFGAGPELFRTGWFFVSLLTELVVLFVVRTRGFLLSSRAGPWLLGSAAAVAVVDFALPYTPLAGPLGFVALPLPLVAALTFVALAYAAVAEVGKRFFYRLRPGRPPLTSTR